MASSKNRRRALVAALLGALVAALASTLPANAASPVEHFRFSFADNFVDTDTCAFPIVGTFIFTNDITQFTDGRVVDLQLHQSDVGTLTGNGVTLRENEHTQTFVSFENGAPVEAKHVGTELHLTGPNGRVALIAGEQIWEVERGFDHTLIRATGVHLDLASDAEFCAAFS